MIPQLKIRAVIWRCGSAQRVIRKQAHHASHLAVGRTDRIGSASPSSPNAKVSFHNERSLPKGQLRISHSFLARTKIAPWAAPERLTKSPGIEANAEYEFQGV